MQGRTWNCNTWPLILKFEDIYVILSKCHCVESDVNFAKKEILPQLIVHNWSTPWLHQHENKCGQASIVITPPGIQLLFEPESKKAMETNET